MLFSDDMRDLLMLFEKHRVEFLLIGGFAVNYYGYVRTTQDLDVLLFPSARNAKAVMEALTEFGFGKVGLSEAVFRKKGSAVHLGVEPNRVDLLTDIRGVCLKTVFANRCRVVLDGTEVPMISRQDLITSKMRSTRLRDRADAEELMKMMAEPRPEAGHRVEAEGKEP